MSGTKYPGIELVTKRDARSTVLASSLALWVLDWLQQVARLFVFKKEGLAYVYVNVMYIKIKCLNQY